MDRAAPAGASLRGGLWHRIKSIALADVATLVSGNTGTTLEQMERLLVEADFGGAAYDLLNAFEEALRRGRLKSDAAIRAWFVERIAAELRDGNSPGDLDLGDGSVPGVVLMLGVNGVGKTTQIAKLARRLRAQGREVLLAAADTYRAGAAEQLQVWATRLGVACVVGGYRADPAAVAFDALEAAMARNISTVLIDTAGRLHTQDDLLEELRKIHRVIARKCPGAPHETLLVLDAAIGQNAVQQGRGFAGLLPVTGLVVTKLDGTAKGGAVIALRRELRIPIRFLGVGEGLDDLEAFDALRFAERLLGD